FVPKTSRSRFTGAHRLVRTQKSFQPQAQRALVHRKQRPPTTTTNLINWIRRRRRKRAAREKNGPGPTAPADGRQANRLGTKLWEILGQGPTCSQAADLATVCPQIRTRPFQGCPQTSANPKILVAASRKGACPQKTAPFYYYD